MDPGETTSFFLNKKANNQKPTSSNSSPPKLYIPSNNNEGTNEISETNSNANNYNNEYYQSESYDKLPRSSNININKPNNSKYKSGGDIFLKSRHNESSPTHSLSVFSNFLKRLSNSPKSPQNIDLVLSTSHKSSHLYPSSPNLNSSTKKEKQKLSLEYGIYGLLDIDTEQLYHSNIKQNKLTSSWETPESWESRLYDTELPINNDFQMLADNNESNEFKNQNQETIYNESMRESFHMSDKICFDNNYDSSNIKINDNQIYSSIRVYHKNSSYVTVICKLNATADYVCKKVAAKYFINDYNKYSLVVVKNKLERIIKPNEYPLLMQKRWLEHLGYTSLDEINLQGREDNSYYYRFIFKEIQIGKEVSPTYWKNLKIRNNREINLSGFGLTILPVYLFQNAPEIVSLDLSRNLNIQELYSDLTPSLTSLKFLSLSHNRIHNFPRNIHCIITLTQINLSFNRIRTLEHTGIEQLKNLLILELQCNLIENIPESIAKGCQNLQYISLSNNRIRSIPVSFFHNLRGVLRHLDISFNRLIGRLPSEIGEMEKLETLRLNGNRMDGDIPKRLSDCIQLRELDLRGNRFGSIMSIDPDGTEILTETENHAQSMEVLSKCKKLEILLLDGNPIRCIGKMSAIEDMKQEMDANIYPSENINFTALKKFSMSYRTSTGIQKPMIFRMTNDSGTLSELNLSFCGLESLPSNFFTNLVNIKCIILDGNHLRKLPHFTSKVPVIINQRNETVHMYPFKIRHLSLHNNDLKYLPDDIGELVELEYLDIRSNRLKTLPESIWQCGKLRAINATSNQLEQFPVPIYDEYNTPLFNALTAGTQDRMAFNISIQSFPPLSFSLLSLFLADNHLTEDLGEVLYFLPNLEVLNASYNEITDISLWFNSIPVNQFSYSPMSKTYQWFTHLQELYLSGNSIAILPTNIGKLHNLSWLFLDNNNLSRIPGEVGKLNKLCAFDVGSQGSGYSLHYNIHNWPYDWNWYWNTKLKYLNFSENKRLELEPKTYIFNQFLNNNLVQDQASQNNGLCGFSTLNNINMLGLMDMSYMTQIPKKNDHCIIRTTSSEISHTGVYGDIIKYSISDTLCRYTDETSSIIPKEKCFLGIWDVAIPHFRNNENESLFGIFDGRGTENGAKLAEYLFQLFSNDFQVMLERVENSVMKERNRDQVNLFPLKTSEPIVLNSTDIEYAIRKTFIGVNKELHRKFNKTESANNDHFNNNEKKYNNEEENNKQFGCSAVIVYMVSNLKKGNCTLYVANIGDSACILSKTGGRAQVISRLFKTGNVMDWTTSKSYNYNQKINKPYLPSPPLSPSYSNSNSYSSSTFKESKFIPGLDDEMERIQNGGGWIAKNNYINGKTDVTRAFGYFDCLGSVNTNPWIEKVELNLKNNNNEFLVLVNGAVIDAFNSTNPGGSSSTLDDTAQKIINIARSALVNESQKRSNKRTSMHTKATNGWISVANKIRDIALSHDAYGARNLGHPKNHNSTVKSSKGMMVMVLGLSDLLTNTPKVF